MIRIYFDIFRREASILSGHMGRIISWRLLESSDSIQTIETALAQTDVLVTYLYLKIGQHFSRFFPTFYSAWYHCHRP